MRQTQCSCLQSFPIQGNASFYGIRHVRPAFTGAVRLRDKSQKYHASPNTVADATAGRARGGGKARHSLKASVENGNLGGFWIRLETWKRHGGEGVYKDMEQWL